MQWRSQDLILGGGGGKNNLQGSERGGGRVWDVPPPTVRAFCILMLLMVQFGAYARYYPRIAQIYIILLWKWLKGGSFTCIHATLFSFFFCLLNFRGGGATASIAPLATPLHRCCVLSGPPCIILLNSKEMRQAYFQVQFASSCCIFWIHYVTEWCWHMTL